MIETFTRPSRYLPAVLVLFVAAGNGYAQEASLSGEASHTLRPDVAVDGAPAGAEVGSSTVVAAVAARFSIGQRTFLTPGISYQGHYLRFSSMPMFDGADKLHSVESSLMLLHMFNQKWAFMGRAAVGLSGDFASLDRHLGFSALGVAVRRFSPRFALGLGALVNYGDDEWLPLPVARVDWQVSDHVFVDALLPAHAKLLYRPGDRWEAGAVVQGEGGRWAIEGEMEDRTINYISIDAGALFGLRMGGDTWFNIMGGWNAYRRYELEGGAGDGDYDPDPGFVLRAGIELRPR